MGRKRKGDGYNEGKYKEVEYFLKGLRAPIFKLININSLYATIKDHLWIKIIDIVPNVQNVVS